MDLEQFRSEVHREFGRDLHRMTPENARGFLQRLQKETALTPGGRVIIEELSTTPEGIMRDFLRRTLAAPSDQAVVQLWLLVLEVLMSSFWEVDEARLRRLLGSDETA